MGDLRELFENNRIWAEKVKTSDPDFFEKLSRQQSPSYLWIGCSDSRVPANQIVGLLPGEVFVHRNIANIVVHSDLNCLSTIQYAVDTLRVEHIIVCGHYGCGGINAAFDDTRLGIVDNWLRHAQDVIERHKRLLVNLDDKSSREALCELNVIEQVANVSRTTIVQDAWRSSRELTVRGWIYNIRDGLLRDLDARVSQAEEITSVYDKAVEATIKRHQGARGEK